MPAPVAGHGGNAPPGDPPAPPPPRGQSTPAAEMWQDEFGETICEIPDYDYATNCPRNGTILLLGKTGGGKSTTMVHLAYELACERGLDACIGFSPTEVKNSELQRFLPSCFVYDTFEEEKVEQILKWQKVMASNGKEQRVGIILDDCMGESSKGSGGKKKRIMSSNQLNVLIKTGRHFGLFMLVCAQSLNDIPPDVQANLALIIVHQQVRQTDAKAVWSKFFSGAFQDWRVFEPLLRQATENYGALVMDLRLGRKNPMNGVALSRANLLFEPDGVTPLKFLLGRPMYEKISTYMAIKDRALPMDPATVLGPDNPMYQQMFAAQAKQQQQQVAAQKEAGEKKRRVAKKDVQKTKVTLKRVALRTDEPADATLGE